ncbi:hypothetical protein TCDM_09520 [Trypanosoma cruzi Dm28c]|uniref:Uncharacterized protein n=1 Tax=Trypanosoma cruzi Dm28c TaxID=1416333 RepID=V5APT6_TRYCR|nr:hypothetical protein TCDM_09520 [Trypanosoma cruzi Dm28c]
MPHAWQHSDMSPPGPSHPSCCWEACPDTTKRAHPQASQTNILSSQITASVSLTSSAGSVMGQLPIVRFADISWILPKYQPREYRSDAQRLAGTPTSQSM